MYLLLFSCLYIALKYIRNSDRESLHEYYFIGCGWSYLYNVSPVCPTCVIMDLLLCTSSGLLIHSPMSLDYCSSLKITDQSNQKVGCNIFCDRLEDHPKIFQLGDIIRMHRVKVLLNHL